MAGQTSITVQSDASGSAINTLPACGQDAPAGSLPVVLDTSVETAVGTAGTRAVTVQGAAGGVPLPVDTVVRGTATSHSGTIAAGGTAQQLMAANASRRGFVVQNQSSGDLYVNGLGTATADQNSLKIAAGDFYETSVQHVGTGAVSIIGATTGQAFYAREY
ncbi:hypothetical protein ACLBYG_20675 [Methylobacterium sp. D53M]